MEKILFVDDEKLPEWFDLPKDTKHAKSYLEALKMWKYGNYDTLYLDYDLGGLYNGADLLLYISLYDMPPKKVYIISINQTGGVKKIIEFCQSCKIPCEDIGQKMMFDKFTILGGQGG